MKDTADPQIAQQIRERGKKYDEAFNKNDATASPRSSRRTRFR
jgi:hypothetical protein